MHSVLPSCVSMKWVVRITALCVVFLGLPILALAQEATILGTVTDPSQAAVPNVAITATNTDTSVVTHTTTNDVGSYVLPDIHIGHYTVQAQAPNFKLAEQKGIVLQVNDRRRVDFQLEIGAANVTMTVEAAPIAVETDSNEISTVITGTQITQLDTNGRSLYQLVTQVPGVASNQSDFQTPTPMGGDQNFSVNGNRQSHILYFIDGGEAADRGGSGPMVMPSLDALNEFRVMTSNFSAEYGLVSGAAVATVVKSGTDQLHASAWWYGRDQSLDGTPFFSPGQLAGLKHFNLYGFNAGGPVSTFIGKIHPDNPKTFFFYNMEWRKELSSGTFNVGNPFTSSYGGDMTAMVAFDLANPIKSNGGGTNCPAGDVIGFPLLNPGNGYLGAGVPYAGTNQGSNINQICQTMAQLQANPAYTGLGAPQMPWSNKVSSSVNAAFTAAGVPLVASPANPNDFSNHSLAFPGNKIPVVLIDPNAAAMAAAGIFPPVANSTSVDSFSGGAPAPTGVREELGRFDHTFNSKVSIFGHWISEQVSQTDIPTRWSWTNEPTSGDTFGNPSYSAVAHLTHTISPTLLNEMAFNYDGNRIMMDPIVGLPFSTSILNAGVPALNATCTAGSTCAGVGNGNSGKSPGPEEANKLFGFQNGTLPQIRLIGGTGAVFNNNWNPWNNSVDDYQGRDDLSWTHGAHQIKMGFSAANFRKMQQLQVAPQGGFDFSGGQFTQYDFSDYLLGLASAYSEAALADHRHWNSMSWAAYVEDDWRATRRLTLNLGMRWDGIPHTAEVNGQMSNFYPSLWNANGALVSFGVGQPGLPGYVPPGGSVIPPLVNNPTPPPAMIPNTVSSAGTPAFPAGWANTGWVMSTTGNGTAGWSVSNVPSGNQICSGPQSVSLTHVVSNAGCTGGNPFLGTVSNPLANGLQVYANGLGVPGITPGVSNGLVPNYWGTIAPRVGLAYDLTGEGKTILRAGFGMFFERIQGNDMYQAASNLFGGSANLNYVWLSNPHVGVDQTNTSISAATLPVLAQAQVFLNSQDYKVPTTYQYSVGIEQQLGKRSVLTVGYVGNESHHESYSIEPNLLPLNFLTNNITTFFTSSGFNGGNLLNTYLPYLGNTSMRQDQNDANGYYNSLQISARTQMHGLQLQAGYTYSRSIDPTTSTGGDGGDLDQVTNPYVGWRFDLGPSYLDRTHIGFVNFVYDLPFWRHSSSRLVKDTLAGWEITGVVTLQSGLPLNFSQGQTSICSAIVGTCAVRPNFAGAVQYPHSTTSWTGTSLSTVQWIGTAGFSNNDPFPAVSNLASWGNLGYDALFRAPGRENWNMALRKTFAAGERLHFEGSFETFNTFNHTQFNGVNTNINDGSGNFGKVNSAWDPRVIQISVRATY